MRRLLVLVPALLGAACGSPTGPGVAVLLRTAAAEARWETNGSSSYAIVQHRSCECLPEMSGPVRLEVRSMPSLPPGPATETVTMRYVSTGEPVPEIYRAGFLTVRQLFALIREARAEGAYRLTAEFDPALGYPSLVGIDYDRDIADDEVVYTMSDYEAPIEEPQD
jgi:hypothetical protein